MNGVWVLGGRTCVIIWWCGGVLAVPRGCPASRHSRCTQLVIKHWGRGAWKLFLGRICTAAAAAACLDFQARRGNPLPSFYTCCSCGMHAVVMWQTKQGSSHQVPAGLGAACWWCLTSSALRQGAHHVVATLPSAPRDQCTAAVCLCTAGCTVFQRASLVLSVQCRSSPCLPVGNYRHSNLCSGHWHWTAVNWGTVQLSNPVPLRMVPHWRWQGGLAAGRCWAAGCGRCQQLLGDSAARAACVTPAAPRDCFLGGAAAATSCHGSHLTTAHLQGREVCGLQGSCAPGVYP